MISISNKSKSRRPKFLLTFSITQLTNIPQSSGYCFCKWFLKDGTGTSSSIIEQEGQKIDTNHQSKGVTERIFVKNHRAKWNYSVKPPIKLKLQVDRNKALSKKVLVVEVFFEFLEELNNNDHSDGRFSHHNNNAYTQKISGKILLGTVSIDVTEFIDKDGTEFHDRFLLQKSKVNSILSMSIKMQLLRGTFEDFRLPNGEQLSQKIKANLENSPDNNSDTSFSNASPISSVHPPESVGSRLSGGTHKTPHPTHKSAHQTGDNLASLTISNQMVEKLYQKTFKFPWDPRPGEYTPQECVEDILDGGNGWAKNEKGINLIDLETLQITDLVNDDYLLASLLDQQGIHYAPTNVNYNWDMLSSKWRQPQNGKSRSEYLKANVQNYYQECNKSGLNELAAEKIKDAKSWKVNYDDSLDKSPKPSLEAQSYPSSENQLLHI
ncbi:unnamed protein product [Kluyveromyces dobzhanskii CBS 2104]|uniref:WGS project CCBQ000000000 data, contig 00011 n=1 Tax=Kluyveromyces dobzhanskii CBS 2104 TaxID=1427455 RepID=A0A0A8LA90_9SACH|nr:unnamed protein product [Kluyveromyces dobzhanskii CBS 2104]